MARIKAGVVFSDVQLPPAHCMPQFYAHGHVSSPLDRREYPHHGSLMARKRASTLITALIVCGRAFHMCGCSWRSSRVRPRKCVRKGRCGEAQPFSLTPNLHRAGGRACKVTYLSPDPSLHCADGRAFPMRGCGWRTLRTTGRTGARARGA